MPFLWNWDTTVREGEQTLASFRQSSFVGQILPPDFVWRSYGTPPCALGFKGKIARSVLAMMESGLSVRHIRAKVTEEFEGQLADRGGQPIADRKASREVRRDRFLGRGDTHFPAVLAVGLEHMEVEVLVSEVHTDRPGKCGRYVHGQSPLGFEFVAVGARLPHPVEEGGLLIPSGLTKRGEYGIYLTDCDIAEVEYVTQGQTIIMNSRPFRYIIIRKRAEQGHLIGEGERRFYLAMATNEWRSSAGDMRWWHREKCGTIELAHDVMKNDLTAGVMPRSLFQANQKHRWRRRCLVPAQRADLQPAVGSEANGVASRVRRVRGCWRPCSTVPGYASMTGLPRQLLLRPPCFDCDGVIQETPAHAARFESGLES